MSGSRARRKPPEEGTGYSWMDTYGDMVTLLLCFFVLLYSFSSIDAEKWEQLVGAFSGQKSTSITVLDPNTVMDNEIKVEGVQKTGESAENEESQANVQINEEAFDRLYNEIRTYIASNQLEAHLMVKKEGDVILLRFTQTLLFDSAKAVLLEEGKPILDHIIVILSRNLDIIKMIRIEGHTDNVPIHTEQFKDNWELSMARAATALEYFIRSKKIDLDKMSAVAYGEYQPVATNDTVEGRAMNRRVDFVVEKMNEEG